MKQSIIDTEKALGWIAADTVVQALIVEESSGWTLQLRSTAGDSVLAARGSTSPHVFRSLDRCITFLRGKLKLQHFDLQPSNTPLESGTDEEFDRWIIEEVQLALDDPRPPIPNEEVERLFAKQRAVLRKRIAEGQT